MTSVEMLLHRFRTAAEYSTLRGHFRHFVSEFTPCQTGDHDSARARSRRKTRPQEISEENAPAVSLSRRCASTFAQPRRNKCGNAREPIRDSRPICNRRRGYYYTLDVYLNQVTITPGRRDEKQRYPSSHGDVGALIVSCSKRTRVTHEGTD